MIEDIKTFDDSNSKLDPLNSVKTEAIARMKAAMLSCSLDDPYSTATALQQITLLRVHHQVARIIQYLDLLDKLEAKLYDAIEVDLATRDLTDSSTVFSLISIQNNLQKSIIESNKLLQPFLDMNEYPIFTQVCEVESSDNPILELPQKSRDQLRENAGAILEELEALSSSTKEIEAEVVSVEN